MERTQILVDLLHDPAFRVLRLYEFRARVLPRGTLGIPTWLLGVQATATPRPTVVQHLGAAVLSKKMSAAPLHCDTLDSRVVP